MSPNGPRTTLRLATLCWLLPMLLGSTAFFGWLAWTGGKSDEGDAFQLLGAAALSAGPAFLLAGVVALIFARQRGADRVDEVGHLAIDRVLLAEVPAGQ